MKQKTITNHNARSNFWRSILGVAIILFAFRANSATIYFNTAYTGSATSSSINVIALVTGSGFTFTSANPSDPTFVANGNDVAGTFSYLSNTNQQISITGVITRQNKSGSITNGLFFYPTGSSGTGYILVAPSRESQFTVGGSYGSSSDPIQDVMNDVLATQASSAVIKVDAPTATEGVQTYITFLINFSNNGARSGTSTFTLALNSATAMPTSDYTTGMEYSFDQITWSSAAGTLSFPIAQASMYVRVPLVNDTIKECSETFTLETSAITGGSILNSGGTFGTGTIYDQENYYLWLGTISTSWALAENWKCDEIPVSGGNVVINSTAPNDLILDQDHIVGYLHFNGSGRKVLPMTYILTASSVIGGNSSNYVQTTSTGKLKMNVSSGGTLTYVVGNSAYNPLSITNHNASADNFSVCVLDEMYTNGVNGTAYPSGRIMRTWDISKANPNTGLGVSFVFNWNNPEIYNLSIPRMYHHNGVEWQMINGTSSSTSNSLTFSNYTGTFSPFAISEQSVLPVTFLEFTAQCVESKVDLHWATATESNTSHFKVESSIDGNNWKKEMDIPAAFNSNTYKNYEVSLNNANRGITYYLLTQYDVDGKSSTYGPIASNCEMEDVMVTVFPNPVNDAFSILIETNEPGNFQISFEMLNGSKINEHFLTAVEGSNLIQMDASGLAPGIYMINIFQGERTFSKKVVVY